MLKWSVIIFKFAYVCISAVCTQYIVLILFRSSYGNVQPTEVFPGACSWMPAAYSSAGPGAGVAAAGYLPAVPASLDVR